MHLSGCLFKQAEWQKAAFTHCKWEKSTFEYGVFKHAQFTDNALDNCLINHSDFSLGTFDHCTLNGCFFSETHCDQTQLIRSSSRRAYSKMRRPEGLLYRKHDRENLVY